MINRLACVGGFRSLHESRPHGTLHAGASAVREFLSSDRVGALDLFLEVAQVVDRREGLVGGFSMGRQPGLFDLADLPSRVHEYNAIYSVGGGLIGDRNPFAIRPNDQMVPCLVEIDCSHNRDQWTRLYTSAMHDFIRESDGLVFKSRRTKDMFSRMWSFWNVEFGLRRTFPLSTVSANSVDLKSNCKNSDLRNSGREQLQLKSTDVVCLLFSRIEPFCKGDLKVFLLWWRRVVSVVPEAKLLISGAAPHPEYTLSINLALADLGLAGSVHVVPDPYSIWSNARNLLMSVADVFIHHSTGPEESMPLTILEAMAHSLPVVVADWAGMGELVEHRVSGFVAPVSVVGVPSTMDAVCNGGEMPSAYTHLAMRAIVDYGAMMQFIKLLVANSTLRMTIGNAALTRVSTEYNPGTVSGRKIEFIEEVCSRSTTESPTVARYFISANILTSGLAGVGRASVAYHDIVSVEKDAMENVRYALEQRHYGIGVELLRLIPIERTAIGNLVFSIAGRLVGGLTDVSGDDVWDSDIGLTMRFVVERMIGAGLLIREEQAFPDAIPGDVNVLRHA